MLTSQQINQLITTVRQHEAQWDAVTYPGGLSAGEARLFATIAARKGQTARNLSDQLGLDTGYVSRMLAEFEARKLLTRAPARHDRRAKTITLTPEGWVLALALDALGEQQLTTLTGHLRAEALPALGQAVATVNSLLGTAPTPPLVFRQLQLGDAGWITYRHATAIAPEFGWDNKFEALCAQILADFITNYDPTCERSWIAERGGQILGSLFLIRTDAETAKLRLLYVEPAARGMGLATKLLEKSIQFARSKAYKKVQLFTTSGNVGARRIYERLGFACIRSEATDLFGDGLMGEIWELVL